MDERRFDPNATAFSAIENASRSPVSRNDVRRMLETGSGYPSHLRALLGDVDLDMLCRLAALFAIGNRTLARAYVAARQTVAAANSELDEFAAQFNS